MPTMPTLSSPTLTVSTISAHNRLAIHETDAPLTDTRTMLAKSGTLSLVHGNPQKIALTEITSSGAPLHISYNFRINPDGTEGSRLTLVDNSLASPLFLVDVTAIAVVSWIKKKV